MPLEKRPLIQGLFGALFGVASIVGPIIGGALTSHVSWRWCFYINLPFGGIALAAVAYCLRMPDREATNTHLKEKLRQLDGIGTLVLVGAVVSLVLVLQWGGQKYSWNNSTIIALLTCTGVLAVAFILTQIFLPRTATLPPRVFKQRSIIAAGWATACVGASMYIFVYFLPIWFQAIKGVSAVDSGIYMLPSALSTVFATIANGFAVQKLGYYTPSAIIGACISCIGAGLLTTLHADTPAAQWIGYQIPYGFGLGMCFQIPNLAAQTVLPIEDVPIGSALMLFLQLLGASAFIPVGQYVLLTQLRQSLAGVSGIDPETIGSTGATSLTDSVPEHLRETVLLAYNSALRVVFIVGLVMACLVVVGMAGLEFKSIKKGGNTGEKKPEAGHEDGDQEKK